MIQRVFETSIPRVRTGRRVRACAGLLSLGLSLPAAAYAQKQAVPMRDAELRASLDGATREVRGTVKVGIDTPIGKIPVTGHGHLRYACDGSFSGTMSYHRVVRFFAKVKGVGLVVALDGAVSSDGGSACVAAPTFSLLGRATVDSMLMSGWVKIEKDSIPFRGPTWTVGDSTYHSVIAVRRSGRPIELKINMYKNPRPPKQRLAANTER